LIDHALMRGLATAGLLSALLCKNDGQRSSHDTLVMFDVTNPVERAHTMAKSGGKNTGFDLKELLSADGDLNPIEPVFTKIKALLRKADVRSIEGRCHSRRAAR
jgi:hypothetical protein